MELPKISYKDIRFQLFNVQPEEPIDLTERRSELPASSLRAANRRMTQALAVQPVPHKETIANLTISNAKWSLHENGSPPELLSYDAWIRLGDGQTIYAEGLRNEQFPLEELKAQLSLSIVMEALLVQGDESEYQIFFPNGRVQIFKGTSRLVRRFMESGDDNQTFPAQNVQKTGAEVQFFFEDRYYRASMRDTSQFYEKLPLRIIEKEVLEQANGYFVTRTIVCNLLTNEIFPSHSEPWTLSTRQTVVKSEIVGARLRPRPNGWGTYIDQFTYRLTSGDGHQFFVTIDTGGISCSQLGFGRYCTGFTDQFPIPIDPEKQTHPIFIFHPNDPIEIVWEQRIEGKNDSLFRVKNLRTGQTHDALGISRA